MANAAFMEQVELDNPNRNRFDLSHEVKLTTDFGKLVPCLITEAVPGDIFSGRSELFTRLAPMTFPVMHRMSATIHFFFVPYRLVFEDWETFWTGGENGDGKNADGVTAAIPNLTTSAATLSGFSEGKLSDYLGLPTNIVNGINLNMMPFRAYQCICNEWYRNQNIKKPYKFSKKGGTVTATEFNNELNIIRNKDWERDLFTASLPWTQRGDIAQISGGPVVRSDAFMTTAGKWVETNTSSGIGTMSPLGYSLSGANVYGTRAGNAVSNPNPEIYNYDPNGTLSTVPATVNDFRQAIRMQELFELYARTGARYYEAILGEFGVRSPDARLNRPEYIGGGRTPVLISEVTSQAQTDQRKLGDFAGHGIVVGDQNTFRYTVQEFGYIIGILSFAPKTGYLQGIERHWLKDDRFDYLHPKLAHLGERPVYNAEIYAVQGATNPLGTFGYQPQYAEYRTVNSRSAGNFRSSMLGWHLDRVFDQQPTLSEQFVDCDPGETSRIFNVTDPNVHHLWVQIFHNVNVIRPLPLFGTPSL